MAGVIGSNSGGYATVVPNDNYVGQALSNVQDTLFKYKAFGEEQKKALREQEQSLREEQAKKDKELMDYQEKHRLTKTGIKPVDTKNYEIALKLQQLNLEGRDELTKARTLEEKTAAMTKIQKASNGFDTINKFNNDYVANQEDIKKNFDKYDPNYLADMAEYGKKFDNGQYEYSLDDDYNVRFNTHDIDPATGKVSAVTAQNLSGDEMASKFRGLPKSNYAGEGDGVSFLDNFSKRIKEKKEITKANGKEITSYPTALLDAEAEATAAVSDPSLRYNVRTQISKVLGIPKTEITDEQVKQKVLNDLKGLIPTPKSETDYQAASYNLSLIKERNDQAERQYQHSKDAKDDTVPSINNEHTVLTNKTIGGKKIANGSHSYNVSGVVNGKEGKGISVKNIIVTPKGGVLFKVQDVGYEGDSKTVTGLTEQGKANIAKYKKEHKDDPKAENYQYQYGDYGSFTTRDSSPKTRLIDLNSKDQTEVLNLPQYVINFAKQKAEQAKAKKASGFSGKGTVDTAKMTPAQRLEYYRNKTK